MCTARRQHELRGPYVVRCDVRTAWYPPQQPQHWWNLLNKYTTMDEEEEAGGGQDFEEERDHEERGVSPGQEQDHCHASSVTSRVCFKVRARHSPLPTDCLCTLALRPRRSPGPPQPAGPVSASPHARTAVRLSVARSSSSFFGVAFSSSNSRVLHVESSRPGWASPILGAHRPVKNATDGLARGRVQGLHLPAGAHLAGRMGEPRHAEPGHLHGHL